MRRSILHIAQILEWADAHRARTGHWPHQDSGPIWETPDEKWLNINNCLRTGLRGLRPGGSLARLLARHRGHRNRKALPKYTIAQILLWADAHHQRTGAWPHSKDGPVANTNGETWWAVDMALRHGQRGMPGGSSLAQLLAAKRKVKNPSGRPRLTERQILQWAKEHHRRTGNWPTEESGVIPSSDGDTWNAVAKALRTGGRGLRRSSLFQLLCKHHGIKRHIRRRDLSPKEILRWADAYFARTGKWPRVDSGPVPEAPGETWQRVELALVNGKRGLPGRESLTHFVATRRKLRTRVTLQKLSEEQVLKWARAFHGRHGYWPTRNDGAIPESQGESWRTIDSALKEGRRGLASRSSLSKLIRYHFKIPAGKLTRPNRSAPLSSR